MAQNQTVVTKTPTKAFGNSPRSLASGGNAAATQDEELAAAAAAFAESAADTQVAAGDEELAAQAQQFASGEQAPAQAQDASLGQMAADAGGALLDGAGRLLDYGGGIARTFVADVAGKVTNTPGVTSDQDFYDAMKGKAPTTAEFLKRAGVGEGGTFNVPGLGPVTARGAAGLAGDIASGGATGELKVLGNLMREIPYLKGLVGAPGKASEALGEAVYKNAVAGVDKKLAARGSGSVGDALIEAGAPIGGTAKLAAKVNSMAETIGKLRQGLYDKATSLGVSIDTGFPLERAEKVLARMEADPGLAPAATELRALLGRYQQAGRVGIDQMSAWKTQLYDALPAGAFGPNGKLKGPAKQFKAALAGDFRDAIVGAGNKAEKGLGDAINKINDKWGTLLEAGPLMNKAAAGGGSGSLGHTVDAFLFGSGHLPAFVAKKSYDLATTAYAKTVIGNALMQAGRSGAVDAVAKRAIVNTAREEKK